MARKFFARWYSQSAAIARKPHNGRGRLSLFITGSDTGVGKTQVTALLLRALRASGVRAVGMKPVCCGDRQDAELLLAESSEGITLDELNPVWLQTPAAPYAASLVEERTIEPTALVHQLGELRRRFDFVAVEGAGGWLVPITRNYFVADLAVDMKLPVLVVVRNRLGCLNHTLLTVRSIAAHELTCVAVVLNTFDGVNDIAAATNAEILQSLLDIPVIGTGSADDADFLQQLRSIATQ
jgi:dethiobiotin synthetase